MKPREFSESVLLGWKLLSFYSLDAAAQLTLCGETEDWFCKESAHRNGGANYLFGCSVAAETSISALESMAEDEGAAEEAACVREFLLELKRLPPPEDSSVWSFAALPRAAEWERLRRLARAALAALNLDCNPPRRAFVIHELVEVYCYRSVEKFRRCPGPSDDQTGASSPTPASRAGGQQ